MVFYLSEDKACLYIVVVIVWYLLILKINTWKPIFKCPCNLSSSCRENYTGLETGIFSLQIVPDYFAFLAIYIWRKWNQVAK